MHCEVGVALRRGRAQVMFLDNICATASHKARTHGPGWRTARANSMDEKGVIVIVYPEGNFRPASCGHYWYTLLLFYHTFPQTFIAAWVPKAAILHQMHHET